VAEGHVVIVRGGISCVTARRVMRFAATHTEGNGPGSLPGWQCDRIAGSNPGYSGFRCIGVHESEVRPRRKIESRYRE